MLRVVTIYLASNRISLEFIVPLLFCILYTSWLTITILVLAMLFQVVSIITAEIIRRK